MPCVNCNNDILIVCGKSGKFCSRRCASQFAAKQPRTKPSEEIKQKRSKALKQACSKFIGIKANCEICNKEYSVKGLPSHIWRMHGEGKNHKPDLKRSFQNGRIIWNKGLTNETSEIVLKISKAVSKTIKNKIKNGTWVPIPPMSAENRKKLSIEQSLHNRGGKCKWFEVAGKKVQGTWERDLANKFEEFSIYWDKLSVNKDIIFYKIGDIEKAYTPDFYLKEYDKFIELKGYWWGNDKEKMKSVFELHPELKEKILIIEKDKYKKLINEDNKDKFLMVLWQ